MFKFSMISLKINPHMKRVVLLLMMYSGIASGANAAADTVSIFSKSMARAIKCIVITPSAYSKQDKRFAVVYLLHGAHGNFSNWVTRVPDMQELADNNELMIVCPDGNPNSWYFDSPVDSAARYETYIATEVPAYIDANYRTRADRQHRAISGLSMGGHGAMFIAFRHAEIFGACGSMSGALDVSMIPKGYGLDKVLGDAKTNAGYYKDWSVINVIEKYPTDSLAIIMDCGTQDILSFIGRAVHEKLMKLKIPHDYIERPGRHDWIYWAKAVRYQLLFFREYFQKSQKTKA
jgi:S-formylglutathione hydrolase FrmB